MALRFTKKRRKQRTHRPELWGVFPLIGFFALWAAFVFFFDGMIGAGWLSLYWAQQYPEVPGTMTLSKVISKSDSEGTIYSPQLEYKYIVNGVSYTGDSYRPVRFDGSSDRGYAREVVEAHPVGAEVTVYYDPSDPQKAFLNRSFKGLDLMMVLFLLPFNLVMVGGWYIAGRQIVRFIVWREEDHIGAYRLWHHGMTQRVRVSSVSPPVVAGATMLGTSFFAIFIVGFSSGFNPGFEVIVPTLVGIVAVSLAIGIVTWLWAYSGSGDVVLDTASGFLWLPRNYYFGPRAIIPLKLIADFVVETKNRGAQLNGRYRTDLIVLYEDPSLHRRFDEPDEELNEKIIAHEYADTDSLRALCDWLKEQLANTLGQTYKQPLEKSEFET